MNKERLEEIQKEVNYAYRRDGSISTKSVTMPIEHYEHLYGQAERAQELEKQNNRYREALEKISAPIDKVTYAYMFAVKQIARQVKHWRVKNDR